MSEIRFRANKKNKGVYDAFPYIEGNDFFYNSWGNAAYIRDVFGNEYEVIPETLRLYTGMLDRNGQEIWEGDPIAGLWYHDKPIVGTVAYSEKVAAFGIKWMRGNVEEFTPFASMCNVEYEVFDCPQLVMRNLNGDLFDVETGECLEKGDNNNER